MIDTRTVGQELQDQVLGVARKGRERVASTVKTVTATAQHIRPQLQNLPRPNLTRPTLVTPAQLREKAPALIAMLPKPRQLKAGAQEFAGQAQHAARIVLGQVRNVTTPLAHQAAARLAKVGTQPTRQETTTRVSEVKVTSAPSASSQDGSKAKTGRATGGTQKTKPQAKAKPTTK